MREEQQDLTSSSEFLLQAFAVCGLAGSTTALGSSQAVRTLNGRQGFQGYDAAYSPALLTCFTGGTSSQNFLLPSQFALCCLPQGIKIIASGTADPTPQVYSIVLTGADGVRLYVSCLVYYEDVPPTIMCQYSELLGARASRCLCLVSQLPYLATMEAALEHFYQAIFVTGTRYPPADIIAHLLQLPCPGSTSLPMGAKLRFEVAGQPITAAAPTPLYMAPCCEVPVRPLFEKLKIEHVILLVLAALLEQRILLRSTSHRLLTLTCEALRQLMYPLAMLNTCIPVLPASLTDYLEAPTPFVMGIHSNVDLDTDVTSELVVVDLDRDQITTEDAQLQDLMSEPSIARLQWRLSNLFYPSTCQSDGLKHRPVAKSDATPYMASYATPVEMVGFPPEAAKHTRAAFENDTLAMEARLMATKGWCDAHEAFIRRLFIECMGDLLDGYQLFKPDYKPHMLSSRRNCDLESLEEMMVEALISDGPIRTAQRSCMKLLQTPVSTCIDQDVPHSGTEGRLTSSKSLHRSPGPSFCQSSKSAAMFKAAEFVEYKEKLNKFSGLLASQLTQTLGFFSFLEDTTKTAGSKSIDAGPYAWLELARHVLSRHHDLHDKETACPNPFHQLTDPQPQLRPLSRGGRLVSFQSTANGDADAHSIGRRRSHAILITPGLTIPPCAPSLLHMAAPVPYRSLPPLSLLECNLGAQLRDVQAPGAAIIGVGERQARLTSKGDAATPGRQFRFTKSLRSRSFGRQASSRRYGGANSDEDLHDGVEDLDGGLIPLPKLQGIGNVNIPKAETSVKLSSHLREAVAGAQSFTTQGSALEVVALAANLRNQRLDSPSKFKTPFAQQPPPPILQSIDNPGSLGLKRGSRTDTRLGAAMQASRQAATRSGVQLEADLVKQQAKALKLLLSNSTTDFPGDSQITNSTASSLVFLPALSPAIVPSILPSLRVHLGSSAWLLITKLHDELGISRTRVSGWGAGEVRTTIPEVQTANAMRYLVMDSTRFQCFVDMLASLVETAIAWKDWSALAALLQAAGHICCSGITARRQTALEALGKVQPLLHSAWVWAHLLRSILLGSLGSFAPTSSIAPVVDQTFIPPPVLQTSPGLLHTRHARSTSESTSELRYQQTTLSPQMKLTSDSEQLPAVRITRGNWTPEVLSSLHAIASWLVAVGISEESAWLLFTRVVARQIRKQRAQQCSVVISDAGMQATDQCYALSEQVVESQSAVWCHTALSDQLASIRVTMKLAASMLPKSSIKHLWPLSRVAPDSGIVTDSYSNPAGPSHNLATSKSLRQRTLSSANSVRSPHRRTYSSTSPMKPSLQHTATTPNITRTEKRSSLAASPRGNSGVSLSVHFKEVAFAIETAADDTQPISQATCKIQAVKAQPGPTHLKRSSIVKAAELEADSQPWQKLPLGSLHRRATYQARVAALKRNSPRDIPATAAGSLRCSYDSAVKSLAGKVSQGKAMVGEPTGILSARQREGTLIVSKPTDVANSTAFPLSKPLAGFPHAVCSSVSEATEFAFKRRTAFSVPGIDVDDNDSIDIRPATARSEYSQSSQQCRRLPLQPCPQARGTGWAAALPDSIATAGVITNMTARKGMCVIGSQAHSLSFVRLQPGSDTATVSSAPLPASFNGCSYTSITTDTRLCAAAGLEHHGLVLVDVATQRCLAQMVPEHSKKVTGVEFDSTGALAVSASLDDTLRLWDVRCLPGGTVSGNAAASIMTNQHGITALLYDESTAQVSTGGSDGNVKIWDLRRLSHPLLHLCGHTDSVSRLFQIQQGGGAYPQLLASCSRDWTVRVWDTSSNASCNTEPVPLDSSAAAMSALQPSTACRAVFVGHGAPVVAGCILRSCRTCHLVSAAEDGSVAMWDVAAGIDSPGAGCTTLAKVHETPIILLASTPDLEGGWLYTGAADGRICAWSAESIATPSSLYMRPRALSTAGNGNPGHRPSLASIPSSLAASRVAPQAQSSYQLVHKGHCAIGHASSCMTCDEDTGMVWTGGLSSGSISVWYPNP